MDLDDTICYCFHVTKRKILNFIRIRKPRKASQISECAGAGTGCGWCRPFLKNYFKDAGDTFSDDMNPKQYAQLRARYIDEGHGKPPPDTAPLHPKAD